eukprot:6195281-Pleurochrysis_carterae.AAC.2
MQQATHAAVGSGVGRRMRTLRINMTMTSAHLAAVGMQLIKPGLPSPTCTHAERVRRTPNLDHVGKMAFHKSAEGLASDEPSKSPAAGRETLYPGLEEAHRRDHMLSRLQG